MDKQVVLPGHLKIIEQAEKLADIEASQKGFKKGSSRWQDAKQKYLMERYLHSDIPHVGNPGAPHVPWILYQEFNQLFGQDGYLAKRLGFPSVSKDSPDWQKTKFAHYEKRIRKAATDLIHVYLELEFGYKAKDEKTPSGQVIPSSFRIPKGSTANEMQKVATAQYVRYTVTTLVGHILTKLFQTSREEIQGWMVEAKSKVESQGVTLPMTPGAVSGKSARQAMILFVKTLREKFRLIR